MTSRLARLVARAHVAQIVLSLTLVAVVAVGVADVIITRPDQAPWLIFLLVPAAVVVPLMAAAGTLGWVRIRAGRPGGLLWSAFGWLVLAFVSGTVLEFVGATTTAVSLLGNWLPLLMAGVAALAWWRARVPR